MSLDTRERLKFTVLTARAGKRAESIGRRADSAAGREEVCVGKKAGVSPRHGGEARNREG
jgi:hypothetical protein